MKTMLDEGPSRALKFTVYALGLVITGLIVMLVSALAQKYAGQEKCKKKLVIRENLDGEVENLAMDGNFYLVLLKNPDTQRRELVKIDSCHGTILSRLMLEPNGNQEDVPSILPMP